MSHSRRYLSFKELGTRVRKLAGEIVYCATERSDSIYYIAKGWVRIFWIHPSGKTITLALIGPGELLGVSAITKEKRRSHSAMAVKNTVLFRVDRDNFLSAMQENPKLFAFFLRQFNAWAYKLEEDVKSLAFLDIRARLARVLVQLFEKHERKAKGNAPTVLRITHDELAEMIGATRENVTNALNQLAREGLIEKRRGRITVLCQMGLREEY